MLHFAVLGQVGRRYLFLYNTYTPQIHTYMYIYKHERDDRQYYSMRCGLIWIHFHGRQRIFINILIYYLTKMDFNSVVVSYDIETIIASWRMEKKSDSQAPPEGGSPEA